MLLAGRLDGGRVASRSRRRAGDRTRRPHRAGDRLARAGAARSGARQRRRTREPPARGDRVVRQARRGVRARRHAGLARPVPVAAAGESAHAPAARAGCRGRAARGALFRQLGLTARGGRGPADAGATRSRARTLRSGAGAARAGRGVAGRVAMIPRRPIAPRRCAASWSGSTWRSRSRPATNSARSRRRTACSARPRTWTACWRRPCKLAVEHAGGDRGFVAFSERRGRLDVVAQHGLGRDRARRVLRVIESVVGTRHRRERPVVLEPRHRRSALHRARSPTRSMAWARWCACRSTSRRRRSAWSTWTGSTTTCSARSSSAS